MNPKFWIDSKKKKNKTKQKQISTNILVENPNGRKPDWRWWQRHSRTLSLYPSQSFWVLKARNKKQIKPKPSQQENSIERNISYPVLMGHRFFPVVWFCLFLCFFFFTVNSEIWIHNPFPLYLLKLGNPSQFKTKIPLNWKRPRENLINRERERVD